MAKRLLSFMLCLLFFLTMLFSGSIQQVNAEEKKKLAESELHSKSCALIDGESGRLLYGKSENVPMANASTTKILTCILALENSKEDDIVTVSENAAAQPKVHLGMKKDEQFYMKDLLYGLMLESFNDCAYAIAEHIDGSAEAFAERMNEKAKEIGCTDSYFVTPNGLDGKTKEGEHHTTAQDLSRIMRYCAWNSPQSETFLALTQTRDHSFCDMDGKSFQVSNKNAFLDMMNCAITGKTGFTAKAGYCYVAAVEEIGRKYCIALLACGWPNNKNYKWADAKKLFQYGLENYHLYEPGKNAFDLGHIEIGNGYQKGSLEEWGSKTKVQLYSEAAKKNLTFLKADWDEASLQKELNEICMVPVKKNQKIGEVSYCINGEKVYSYPIRTVNEVKKWDLNSFGKAVMEEFLP